MSPHVENVSTTLRHHALTFVNLGIYMLCGEMLVIKILIPRQNSRHFADDIFKWIFLDENRRILIRISLKLVPNGPIDDKPTLFQIMVWHRTGTNDGLF